MSIESTMATEILNTTLSALSPVLEQIAWGEDEITKGMRHHPHAADALHHSFTLLRPTSDRMNTEFVYRRHCQELLDRVAISRSPAGCSGRSRAPDVTTASNGVRLRPAAPPARPPPRRTHLRAHGAA